MAAPVRRLPSCVGLIVDDARWLMRVDRLSCVGGCGDCPCASDSTGGTGGEFKGQLEQV